MDYDLQRQRWQACSLDFETADKRNLFSLRQGDNQDSALDYIDQNELNVKEASPQTS